MREMNSCICIYIIKNSFVLPITSMFSLFLFFLQIRLPLPCLTLLIMNLFIVPAQLHAIIDRAPQRSARWNKTKRLLALTTSTTLSLPVVRRLQKLNFVKNSFQTTFAIVVKLRQGCCSPMAIPGKCRSLCYLKERRMVMQCFHVYSRSLFC